MGSGKRTECEVVELARTVADAASGIPSWQLPQSVLGRFRLAAPAPHSEYAMFTSCDFGRTARYLADVVIPSFHRRAPWWFPAGLRSVFFHHTTIQHRPDQAGSYDSFPMERWLFINGILTDAGMAAWNADYLAALFHRPFTIIQTPPTAPSRTCSSVPMRRRSG